MAERERRGKSWWISIGVCVCVCVYGGGQVNPRGLDTKAKLPMQIHAVEASKELLHVIWMRLVLPTEQLEHLMSVIDLTLRGILARWSVLFLVPFLFPPFTPSSLSQQHWQYTAVFHFTAEQLTDHWPIWLHTKASRMVLVNSSSCIKTNKSRSIYQWRPFSFRFVAQALNFYFYAWQV